MKKVFAIIMVLALAISAIALPALAEETTGAVDQVTTATTQTGRGGRGSHPQQMPGQNGQQFQMHGQNGQLPQMPGQNSQNGQQFQMPGRGNQNMNQGKGAAGRFRKAGMRLDLDQLLKDGVITREVYDAITNYLKEQVSQQADAAVPAEGAEPPALPDGTTPAEGAEPPALPDGTAPAEGSKPQGMEEQLLKDLLDSGVITQEQYDLLLTKVSAAPAPSDT